MDKNPVMHDVVIIDAGSRGIHPEEKWKKSDVNATVMHKFWKACDNIGVPTEALKDMWRKSWTIEKCLENVEQQWFAWPILTEDAESMCKIQQSREQENQMHRSEKQRAS